MTLIRAEDTAVALKMRKNARNNEIDLITKIVAVKSFVCSCESRMKRTMIQKMTETATIARRKNTLQRIVSNSNRIIFKSTLWKIFDKTFNRTDKRRFYYELSSKFRMIRKIKWARDDCRRNCESQKEISKHICWIICSDRKQMKKKNDHVRWWSLN